MNKDYKDKINSNQKIILLIQKIKVEKYNFKLYREIFLKLKIPIQMLKLNRVPLLSKLN